MHFNIFFSENCRNEERDKRDDKTEKLYENELIIF